MVERLSLTNAINAKNNITFFVIILSRHYLLFVMLCFKSLKCIYNENTFLVQLIKYHFYRC